MARQTPVNEFALYQPSTNFRVTWSLWWLLPCLSASWYSLSENLEKRGKEKGNRGLQWWDWRMFMGLAFEDMNSPRVSLGLQWSMQSWHHPLCARMPSWRLAVSILPQRLAPGLYQFFFIILNSNAGHVGMLRNLWKQLILFMAFKNQKKMLKNDLKGTCSLLFWDPPTPVPFHLWYSLSYLSYGLSPTWKFSELHVGVQGPFLGLNPTFGAQFQKGCLNNLLQQRNGWAGFYPVW